MMIKIISAIIFALLVLMLITACSSTPTTIPTETAPILPPDEFSHFDKFGDGYIAKVKISEVENIAPEKIINTLVDQWLQHYKTQSTYKDASVKDFSVDYVNLLTKPANSIYAFVAGVKFSIIPSKTPNDYASTLGRKYPESYALRALP
jgi:hypothetical protein